jgi:hypothetical protein
MDSCNGSGNRFWEIDSIEGENSSRELVSETRKIQEYLRKLIQKQILRMILF